jgi:hypothetical protein
VTHQLTFASAHDYGTDAIIIPVMLRLGNVAARTDAYLDTGATFCVFKRSLAEPLGLEVETGEPLRLSTVTGSFERLWPHADAGNVRVLIWCHGLFRGS